MQGFIKIKKLEGLELFDFQVVGFVSWLLSRRDGFSCCLKQFGLEDRELEIIGLCCLLGLDCIRVEPYRFTWKFLFRCPDDYVCVDCSGFDWMSFEEIGESVLNGSLELDKESLLDFDESLLDGQPESFRR